MPLLAIAIAQVIAALAVCLLTYFLDSHRKSLQVCSTSAKLQPCSDTAGLTLARPC